MIGSSHYYHPYGVKIWAKLLIQKAMAKMIGLCNLAIHIEEIS